MEKSDCLKCMKNGAFQSNLPTDIVKEQIKHISLLTWTLIAIWKVQKYQSHRGNS